jgi:sugar fermentation stimulation protein A
MQFSSVPIIGSFEKRLNRFLGMVRTDRKIVECFIPNPGRMKELLYPGKIVYLLEKKGKNRRTDYDLVLVNHDDILVSIDSRIPNKVVGESIQNEEIPEFKGLKIGKKELYFLDSRLDFLLNGMNSQLMLEIKSCTLVVDRVAMFPDAPTKRGTRHIHTLDKALGKGRASIFFLIQRDDARDFQPNWNMDPDFAEALLEAETKGIEIYAYDSNVSKKGVFLNKRIPVKIDGILT